VTFEKLEGNAKSRAGVASSRVLAATGGLATDKHRFVCALSFRFNTHLT
jgi:hypothetical protein